MSLEIFVRHRRSIVVLTLLLAAVFAGGFVIRQRYFFISEVAPHEPASPVAEEPVVVPPSGPAKKPPDTAPAYIGAPVQALNPDPDILKQVPADTYGKSRKELASLAVEIAVNPRNAGSWERVAFIKRFYGDYSGAKDAYEYLNLIAEGDALYFFSVAGLYGYYLKEPAMAESKYEAALKRDPMNPTYYSGFADFYRDTGKISQAEVVLEKGLARMPNDIDLLISYAYLSKTAGRTERAIEYYERALSDVSVSPDRRASILEEVERLK